jgi:hypothetical protein
MRPYGTVDGAPDKGPGYEIGSGVLQAKRLAKSFDWLWDRRELGYKPMPPSGIKNPASEERVDFLGGTQ